MATTLQCDIVSAEAQIYSGAVELLVATGVEGELGVCFGHAALLTRLIPGPIRVVEQGGEEQVYYASGGFLEVQGDVVTVLADTAVRADDIDEAAAETARKDAEDALHVRIAPEGAAAAPAEDVEKGTAELMTVDTEGLPESPAYEV